MRPHAAAVVVIAILTAACGGTGDDAASSGGISVSDAWARPTPSPHSNTAIYMTVANDGTDAASLIAADGEACGVTEIHMTSMEGDVMTMSPVEDGIAVTPGSAVTLGPGGLHIMCIEAAEQLDEGSTMLVTLEFADAASIEVVATIRRDE